MSTTTIEEQIAQTQEQLDEVKSRETEIYSRIVGYYRNTRQWNCGKKQEFKERKTFDVSNYEKQEECAACKTDIPATEELKQEVQLTSKDFEGKIHFKCFIRKTCPNCGPVKTYLTKLDEDGIDLPGTMIDVDTEEGLDQARTWGVMSAPSFILFGRTGQVIANAHDIVSLKTLLKTELSLGA